MRRTILFGSASARTVAACASVAVFTLLASTASAQFRVHPRQGSTSIARTPEDDLDRFGAAVAIRSELAFIGAPDLPPGGKVVVYRATPTGLSGTATLGPSDPVPFEGFGQSLAYRDGILLVGSNQATYVFQRNSSGVWTQRQKLPPSGAFRHEDGTLAIGASGAVDIYQRNTAGKFVLRQKLVSPDSAPNDGLGDISLAGPTMVVGGNGRAYVFKRNSTGVWRHRQTLIASESGTEDAPTGFGSAVAIDRGMIIVGAPDLRGDLFSSEGAAYGFVLDGALYVETFKLQPRLDGYDGFTSGFGQQIAMFGERIVVRAFTGISTDCDGWQESAFSYTRAGSSVLPRGVASWSGLGGGLALADQRLLVGIPCDYFGIPEPGHANFYRLNVFE
jgi:hypothetical protein